MTPAVVSSSLLTPPEAFGIVEPGVFRSNMFHTANFPFVKRLNLRKVIILGPEAPPRAVTSFFEENNVELMKLGLTTWAPSVVWKPFSDELVKQGLETILNVHNHPIMVMCTTGVYQTGTFVGCLRKLQRWNFTAILSEYRSFASGKHRYGNELFIELFDTDLITLPRHLPAWFEDANRMMEREMEARNALVAQGSSDKQSVERALYLLSH